MKYEDVVEGKNYVVIANRGCPIFSNGEVVKVMYKAGRDILCVKTDGSSGSWWMSASDLEKETSTNDNSRCGKSTIIRAIKRPETDLNGVFGICLGEFNKKQKGKKMIKIEDVFYRMQEIVKKGREVDMLFGVYMEMYHDFSGCFNFTNCLCSKLAVALKKVDACVDLDFNNLDEAMKVLSVIEKEVDTYIKKQEPKELDGNALSFYLCGRDLYQKSTHGLAKLNSRSGVLSLYLREMSYNTLGTFENNVFKPLPLIDNEGNYHYKEQK